MAQNSSTKSSILCILPSHDFRHEEVPSTAAPFLIVRMRGTACWLPGVHAAMLSGTNQGPKLRIAAGVPCLQQDGARLPFTLRQLSIIRAVPLSCAGACKRSGHARPAGRQAVHHTSQEALPCMTPGWEAGTSLFGM